MKLIKSMEYKHKTKLKILILMLLSFSVYLILIFQENPLHTSSDELGGISSAAYFAGRDWHGVMKEVGYYGAGYHIFFSWIFKLTDNPVIIYRTVLMIGAFLRILIIPIAYNILEEFWELKNERVKLLLSASCSFMYSTRISGISNEYIIELIVWLVLFVMCHLIKNYNNVVKKNIFSFLFIILLMYGLTIHTRALTLLIAAVITFIIMGVIYHKCFFAKWQIIVATAMYFGVKLIIQFVQGSIWGTTEGLRNGTVSIAGNIELFNYKTWLLWADMAVGAINTMAMVTGGLFIVAVVTIIRYSITLIRKNDWNKYNNVYIVANNIFMVLCIGATIAALLVSNWFMGAFTAFMSGNIEPNLYAMKGITYIRYWEPYVPPLILFAAVALEKNNWYKKNYLISICILIGMQVYFIKMILPFIKNNGACLTPLYSLALFEWGDAINENSYLCCIGLTLGIVIVMFAVLWKKQNSCIWMLFAGWLIFQQIWGVIHYDIPVQQAMYDKVNSTNKYIDYLEEKGMVFDNIYAVDVGSKEDNNWKIYYILQFYLNRYTVKMQLPDQYGKNDLIVTNGVIEWEIPKNIWFKCIQIDDNEYWYLFDEKYLTGIEGKILNE